MKAWVLSINAHQRKREIVQTRLAGQTGLSLSEIALGTWGLATNAYGPTVENRLESTVIRALDVGVRTFDVAPTWGESESVVAKQTRALREETVLITRGGMNFQSGKLIADFSPASLRQDVEASLKTTSRDALDIWLLNHPDARVIENAEMWDAARALLAEGKLRAWGISTTSSRIARRALQEGASVVCMPYNLLFTDEVHELASDLATSRAALLARSPLSYGLLSGTWSHAQSFVDGDHRARRWNAEQLRKRVHAASVLEFLARGKVADLAEASLRFVLSNALVTSAVVGARNASQIAHASRAAEGPPYLDEEHLIKVPQILAALGM